MTATLFAMVTMFGLLVLPSAADSQRLPPMLVHVELVVKPLITGFAPLPYRLITIGAVADPDFVKTIVPVNVSPDLNKMESPGAMDAIDAFSFAILSHALSGAR